MSTAKREKIYLQPLQKWCLQTNTSAVELAQLYARATGRSCSKTFMYEVLSGRYVLTFDRAAILAQITGLTMKQIAYKTTETKIHRPRLVMVEV